MGLLGQTGVWMTPVNALLSEVSAEEGLHWRFLGEYGYSIVILFYVGYFLPFFITVAICKKKKQKLCFFRVHLLLLLLPCLKPQSPCNSNHL